MDFYGHGAFDRAQGSQVAMNKKSIFDHSRNSGAIEKTRDGDGGQVIAKFDAFGKVGKNPQDVDYDTNIKNKAIDASGKWNFALDGMPTQAKTPGKAKKLTAALDTEE